MCKLPHHRRINWRIAARNNQRGIRLVFILLAVASVLALVLWGLEAMLGEADKRMKLTALQKDVMYVRQFGSPYAHQRLDEMDSDIRLRRMK